MMRLLVVTAVMALASGCSCAGREFTLKRTFDVNSGPNDALCSTNRQVINLGEDSSFNSVKNNVGKVELRKLVVRVVDPKTASDSVATKANGKVRVSETMTGTGTEMGTYQDVPLEADASQEIAFDKAAASQLASLALNPPNTFYIESEGCNDKVPAHYKFQVELTLYAELKLF